MARFKYNQVKKKQDRIQKYRKEVSKKASIANKRIRRLEEKGMNTPALESWRASGGEYFSIRGKDYNEVQAEMARINEYLNSATSSITGAKKVLNELTKQTGMNEWETLQHKNWKDINKTAKKFFEVASKVEQYLSTVDDRASAVGYQSIWEAINSYVKDSQNEMSFLTDSAEDIAQQVVKTLDEFEDEIYDEFAFKSPFWGVPDLDKVNPDTYKGYRGF